MDTHVFFLIIRNEMKLQMRSWVFRFFVVLSLVGVVVCQMYRQGGDDIHWKMVGLPCSIPLVNAYLFSLVQSLFLIVIMSDFPRRLVRSGLRDGVLVRPFGNTLYYWGSLTGVFLSFMAVCLSVMFVDDSLLGVCRRLNGVFEQLCFKIDGFAGRDIVVSGRFLVIALCWTWNLRFLCCGGA